MMVGIGCRLSYLVNLLFKNSLRLTRVPGTRPALSAACSPFGPALSIGAGELNRKRNAADKAPEQPWSTAMLAEIFMLRLEAAARAAKFQAGTPSRFVPITLPASAA